MIPGYPLDSGCVLRAVIWWITGNATHSTRLAAQVGHTVAFLFILAAEGHLSLQDFVDEYV